ncbi:MAG: hypothetical protein Tsb0014_30690 [Pleurocapsa sp.]
MLNEMTVSLDRINTRLEQTLTDIAHNIQIQDNFTIIHPQYDPIELPAAIKERFKQMSELVREQYLQVKLQSLIHDCYHNCSPTTQETEKIENQAIKWSKSEFYHQLRLNNHCQGHFEPGWLIVGMTEEGFLQVRKNDLTLHIRSERHLLPNQQNARIGDIVAVKMPPQLVEPGFYIAVGTNGSINDFQRDRTIVDVYCHVNSEGALALMDRLTVRLNKIAIPFHFKVLYYPDDYQWCDAAVLSFARDDYPQVQPILAEIYNETQSHFQPQIPLFTKYLAPGLALAEKPPSDGSLPKTFAEHCSQLIAQGLIAAWKAHKQTPEAKLQSICDRFAEAEISLSQPYLNPGSEDIYHIV